MMIDLVQNVDIVNYVFSISTLTNMHKVYHRYYSLVNMQYNIYYVCFFIIRVQSTIDSSYKRYIGNANRI